MPANLSWERNSLATFFDFLKRTRQFNKTSDNSSSTDVVFEAGEFALTDGGIPHAFVEFVQRRGYRLTPQEQALHRMEGRSNLKRYCVVLSRMSDGQYLVCYLATHNKAFYGKNIRSPIGRFFSIAIGDTAPWPPGYDSIKVSPPWPEGTFVFGVPIVRSHLTVPKFGTARRFLVQSGELQRLKSFIQKRIELFDEHHRKFRMAHIQHLSLSEETLSAKEDLRFTDSLAERIAAEGVASGSLIDVVERPTIVPTDTDRPTYGYRVSRKIHWLKPDYYHNNGRYLIQHLGRSVMQSSLYLRSEPVNRPRVRFNTLPKPFYAPLLRKTSANTLLRLIS